MPDAKKPKMTEEELRNHVRNLREFYTNFSMYAAVNAALFIIWIITGAGAFWPFWTIFFWGGALAVQAMNAGLFNAQSQECTQKVLNFLPFLKNSWEDEQVKKMAKGGGSPKTSPAATHTPAKEAAKPAPKLTPKPKAVSKTATKKPATKSAAAKKAPVKKATTVQKSSPKLQAKPPVGKIYE